VGWRGVLITFEGVEGAGKSTQMARLGRALRHAGRAVELTREPDGTRLGVAVRRIFARPGVVTEPLAEVLLFMAARRQHVVDTIVPALRRGAIVLCDRYTDATVAYQGYGRGFDQETIRALNLHVTGGVLPDLTLLFDLQPAEGFRRIGRRRLDEFERRALSFHRRVRRGYLEIQRAEPKRVRLIRADRAAGAVAADVRAIVDGFLAHAVSLPAPGTSPRGGPRG
jgi:dTMP kinase